MSIYKDRLYQILTQHFPYIWGQSSTRHHFRKFLVWARLKSVCRKLLLGPGSNYYVPGGRKLLMWARGSNYYVEHFWATGSNYCVENPIWGHRLKLLYKKLLGWATGSNPCVENSFWATGSNYCLLCKKLLCLATGSIFLVGNCWFWARFKFLWRKLLVLGQAHILSRKLVVLGQAPILSKELLVLGQAQILKWSRVCPYTHLSTVLRIGLLIPPWPEIYTPFSVQSEYKWLLYYRPENGMWFVQNSSQSLTWGRVCRTLISVLIIGFLVDSIAPLP